MAVLNNIGGVLFDLDGTFADTAHDLAFALNETLRHFGREPLPFDAIRPVVSHGGIALIRLGFDLGPDDKGYTPRREHLLRVYQDNIARQTRLFDGMEQVIDTLEAAGIPWGIVTNKPAWLTDPLMTELGMSERAAAIVSGDTCAHNKPHPEPIQHACRQLGVAPVRCLYVGDAGRDIEAGRAAGSPTVAALFGYLMPDDDPADWHADHHIEHPLALLGLLGLESAARHAG
jgi:phosphoglycolate phosphatase